MELAVSESWLKITTSPSQSTRHSGKVVTNKNYSIFYPDRPYLPGATIISDRENHLRRYPEEREEEERDNRIYYGIHTFKHLAQAQKYLKTLSYGSYISSHKIIKILCESRYHVASGLWSDDAMTANSVWLQVTVPQDCDVIPEKEGDKVCA